MWCCVVYCDVISEGDISEGCGYGEYQKDNRWLIADKEGGEEIGL